MCTEQHVLQGALLQLGALAIHSNPACIPKQVFVLCPCLCPLYDGMRFKVMVLKQGSLANSPKRLVHPKIRLESHPVPMLVSPSLTDSICFNSALPQVTALATPEILPVHAEACISTDLSGRSKP